MDKDILELFSDMLKKQDRHTQILEDFTAVSIRQWEAQQQFNETFFTELKSMNLKLDNSQTLLTKLVDVEERIKRLEKLEDRIHTLENK